jgi:hypothetical protein
MFRNLMRAALLLALGVLLFPQLFVGVALAAVVAASSPDTTVTLGWGDVASQLLGDVAVILAGVVSWALRKLPAQLYALIVTLRAEQAIDKAIGFATNSVAGAVKGKELTVDVGIPVLAMALKYLCVHLPAWLLSWLGGPAQVAQKIWARLPMAAGATTPDFNAIVDGLDLR